MNYGLIGVLAGVGIILIAGAPVLIWGERDPTKPKEGREGNR